MKKTFLSVSLALILAGCAHQPVGPSPENVNVHLYRGLRVQAGTVNQIDWTRVSFGVSGQPPTLSFFNAQGDNFPCLLRITVAPGNAPVPPGTQAALDIPNPPPGGANPGPWAVDFDNNPAGHWSIARPVIGGASNAQASDRAAAVFHAMAQAGTAGVLDGTAAGCH